jgi:hypothetical protein
MKFNTVLTFLFCIIFSLGSLTPGAYGQRDNRGEEKRLIDKLWFGGNIGLGFNGSQFNRVFFIGLAPMVGYKITDDWSVGPRLDLSYTHIRQSIGGNVEKLGFVNVGAALFTRYKVFNNFFAHLESGLNNIPYTDRDDMGNLIVVREQRITALVGVGYTAGGGEIVFLYDLNAPDDSLELPFDFRFGFNYNF